MSAFHCFVGLSTVPLWQEQSAIGVRAKNKGFGPKLFATKSKEKERFLYFTLEALYCTDYRGLRSK